MPGAIAYGLHEGSRSEYLAQFAFSAFGTAVAIPHQEDAGIDLFCHFVERVGRHARSRFPYTVQVKSGMDPWVFEGEEAIRWLVDYPLPLFLCVVDKADGRLRTYHTAPRFYYWSLGEHADRITMAPQLETEGRCVQWSGSFDFSLTAPILDFHVTDILQDEFRASASEVLAFWAEVEFDNLRRLKSGVRKFKMPDGYRPNATRITRWSIMGRTIGGEEHTERGFEHAKEVSNTTGSCYTRNRD